MTKLENITELPVLPLRDSVIFPKMVLPLFVGRPDSMRAVDVAYYTPERLILLVAQKNLNTKKPAPEDLYEDYDCRKGSGQYRAGH